MENLSLYIVKNHNTGAYWVALRDSSIAELRYSCAVDDLTERQAVAISETFNVEFRKARKIGGK